MAAIVEFTRHGSREMVAVDLIRVARLTEPKDGSLGATLTFSDGRHVDVSEPYSLVLELWKKAHETRADLPEASRVPTNVDEAAQESKFIEMEGYEVLSWTPERDGKGRSTQVWFVQRITLADLPVSIVLRLHSRGACQQLIDALARHMFDVFPGGGSPT